jgi:N-acetylglucosaminyldiphosphoundecaprenol N-acetyl-beta-D-mannosaminyltransferase
LKPVWPVTSTRRLAQKSESIATARAYLLLIDAQTDASRVQASGAKPPTADILGIPLAISDYERVIDWMEATIAARERAYVTAAAVNLVMSAREDPATLAAVLGATLAVPDGQPLVWALRALGHADATRVYGPDLMARFCARAAARGTPMYLYGGRSEEALALLQRRLRERFPGIVIAGGFSPPFRELDEREQARALEQINSSGASVVWVGTGQPKQELWMARVREELNAPMLVGVGAAFDFHAGLVSQAPRWMQRNGLEWLYRLSREPRRLWRRYARYNPRFVAGFARQYARHARDGRARTRR